MKNARKLVNTLCSSNKRIRVDLTRKDVLTKKGNGAYQENIVLIQQEKVVSQAFQDMLAKLKR